MADIIFNRERLHRPDLQVPARGQGGASGPSLSAKIVLKADSHFNLAAGYARSGDTIDSAREVVTGKLLLHYADLGSDDTPRIHARYATGRIGTVQYHAKKFFMSNQASADHLMARAPAEIFAQFKGEGYTHGVDRALNKSAFLARSMQRIPGGRLVFGALLVAHNFKYKTQPLFITPPLSENRYI